MFEKNGAMHLNVTLSVTAQIIKCAKNEICMVMNYVSVSGISAVGQLEKIGEIREEEKLGFPIVIGYQVSSKSINQGTANPRQPLFAELDRLSAETLRHGFFPAFHYYTKDDRKIIPDLELLAGHIGTPALLQLNTLPPDVGTMQRINDLGFQVILKAAVSNKDQGGYKVWTGDAVQDAAKGNIDVLVNDIRQYAGLVAYVMFDPSHGTNLGLDVGSDSLAVRFGKRIRRLSEFDDVGLVYAGGIGPINVVTVVNSLCEELQSGFSIDTESAVRDIVREGDSVAKDELNLSQVREYLMNYQKTVV
jgi:hypothetical protein